MTCKKTFHRGRRFALRSSRWLCHQQKLKFANCQFFSSHFLCRWRLTRKVGIRSWWPSLVNAKLAWICEALKALSVWKRVMATFAFEFVRGLLLDFSHNFDGLNSGLFIHIVRAKILMSISTTRNLKYFIKFDWYSVAITYTHGYDPLLRVHYLSSSHTSQVRLCYVYRVY